MTETDTARPPLRRWARPLMGTVASVLMAEPAEAGGGDRSDDDALVEQVFARLVAAEADLSLWRSESPLSRWRRGEASLEAMPVSVRRVLRCAAEVRAMSGGFFDADRLGGRTDPTGVAKGWAVEQAAEVLRRAQRAGIVAVGGDLVCVGLPSGDWGPASTGERLPGLWPIGVRHPWRRDALARVVGVEAAIAISGAYERGAHLVDPYLGQPACRAASATVVGPRLDVADGLATALAVGADAVLARIEALASYEAYLVRSDGSEAETSGLVTLEAASLRPLAVAPPDRSPRAFEA